MSIQQSPGGRWRVIDPVDAKLAYELELDRLHRRANRRLRRRPELERLEPLSLAEFNRRGADRRRDRDRPRRWWPLAIALGVCLGLLGIFGLARADAATIPAYPAGAPATSPLMLELEADVARYWRSNGLDDRVICPGGVEVDLATNLGLAAGTDNGPAGGQGGGCHVWLDADLVGHLQHSARIAFFAPVAGRQLWTLLAHEYGHALGQPHTATGLMCGPPASGEHYCPSTAEPAAVAFAGRLEARELRTDCRKARATRRTATGHRARQRARKRARTACSTMRDHQTNVSRFS